MDTLVNRLLTLPVPHRLSTECSYTMNITHHFCALTLLTVALFLASATTARHIEEHEAVVEATENHHQTVPEPLPVTLSVHHRSKRAFGDFFGKLWTVGSLGKAQYDDTRTTLAKIYEILRDNFSDTMVKKTVSLPIANSWE